MRILVVSQYHEPEPSAITISLIEGLKSRGHEVSVLTGFPNYPDGKIYPGWRQRARWRRTEKGIEVWRVPIFMDHSQRLWARILNYISFGISSSVARRASREVDVIYVYATQMTAAIGPWVWSAFKGKPYVLHVQDLWPESVIGSSIAGGAIQKTLIKNVLAPWLQSIYNRASHIVGIAPTMVETLRSRVRAETPVSLVYNWFENQYRAPLVAPLGEARPTRILYAGNIGEMQELDIAVHAAARSRDAGIELVLVGSGVARTRLESLAVELNADNISFRDSVPVDQMPNLYGDVHYGLVSLKDLEVFKGTIPSKLQALLSAGVPIVSNVQGDVRTLCQSNNVGFTADAASVDDLERAFRSAAKCAPESHAEMSTNAQLLSQTLFSKAAAIAAMETILAAAADRDAKADNAG